MCGISGIINFYKKPSNTVVMNMNESIRYRGPDHQAIWNNIFCSIGIVRLKILDLSDRSNQPFLDLSAKISVIYNGEIYNYKELKKKYFINEKFNSNGDGEVIIKLYKKFGINFLHKIKGMFSILIVDETKNKIFLIRDRFGIKQLYYHFNKDLNELSFCSEIKGLFSNKKIEKKINFSEIHKVLDFGLIDSNNETCFADILKVPAGSYIEFSKKGLDIKNYYKLEDSIDESLDDVNNTFKFYTSNLKEKIIKSFLQHTDFDVAGGIHMSGGSDSALLAAMSSYTNKKLSSYTFDFKDKQFSEVYAAKELAISANLKHKSAVLKEENLIEYLHKVIKIQYEPFSSLRLLSQNYLYEMYKDESKVILDGSGGDEIGAGYRYYLIPWYLDVSGLKLRNLKSRFLKNIGTLESLNVNDFINGSIKNYLSPGLANQDGSIFIKNNFLNNDFIKSSNKDTSFLKKPFKSHLRNAQYTDFYYSKLPRSLRYTDRASMRSSVEARLPFLDHEVVEQCFQIPSKFKFLMSQDRIITKSLFYKNIKKSILMNNKRTIADPQTLWIKKNLNNFINDSLSSSNFLSNDIINRSAVKKFVKEISKTKKHVNTSFLIRILLVEWWRKSIITN